MAMDRLFHLMWGKEASEMFLAPRLTDSSEDQWADDSC